MALKNNVGGVQKTIIAWMNVAGTWKKCAVKHNVSAVWKQLTSLISAYLQATDGTATNTVACTATFTIHSDGNIYATSGTGVASVRYAWRLGSNPSSDYVVRVNTPSIGSFTSGAINSWQNCGSNWNYSRASGITDVDQVVSALVEIAEAANTANILASATFTLTATRTSGGA